MRAALRAGFIGALMAAAPAFAQNGGALAPASVKDKLSSQENSPLTQARQEVTAARRILIREGIALVGVLGTAARTARAARKAVASAVKGWAACLGRIFLVDVIKCARCGGTMRAIASITDDAELERLLSHVGMEADLPRTRPARGPPAAFGGEGSQVDPGTDAWDGKDAQPADE